MWMRDWKRKKMREGEEEGIWGGKGERRKGGQAIGHTCVCGRESTPYIDPRTATLFGVGKFWLVSC